MHIFFQNYTITIYNMLIMYIFLQHYTITTGKAMTMHIFLQHFTMTTGKVLTRTPLSFYCYNKQSIDSMHIFLLNSTVTTGKVLTTHIFRQYTEKSQSAALQQHIQYTNCYPLSHSQCKCLCCIIIQSNKSYNAISQTIHTHKREVNTSRVNTARCASCSTKRCDPFFLHTSLQADYENTIQSIYNCHQNSNVIIVIHADCQFK